MDVFKSYATTVLKFLTTQSTRYTVIKRLLSLWKLTWRARELLILQHGDLI